jgi:uncharacterized protein YyaL (SSP411 family)
MATPPDFRPLGVLILTCVLVLIAGAVNSSANPEPGAKRNHLAGEASPYLQLHVYNPVEWYPWGKEAFDRAQREDKPIFLSVGYSTCYWCHVMERKVFSDPAIAKQMNESFINIKVDREERPDIDEIYMRATHLLTRSGGWPNSVFLTPKGKPFFAGTYFPPEDTGGRPGFPSVLTSLSHRWKSQHDEALAQAERVADAINSGFLASEAPTESFDTMLLLEKGVATLQERFDGQYGGFSMRTKFPSPAKLELLLTAHQRKVPGKAGEMLRRSLNEMAYGGIQDQLAGGFHRYTVERTWSVPHFEKMLYDNAQLLGLYARAYTTFDDPLYRRVAENVADYLAAEMTHPMGGLYSAQDAEVDGEEGESYIWSEPQIVAAIGEERAKSFLEIYALAPVRRGHGAIRMRRPKDPTEAITRLDSVAKSRADLLAVRSRRKQPLRDEKILAAWNGLAIRGLVDAGVELSRPDYVDQAARAAHFVLSRLKDDQGRLHRSFVAGSRREAAVLDDYAFLADGLIALHSATGQRRWLISAKGLADRMIADYEGPPGTGFYLSLASSESDGLFVRPRVLTDNVRPAGNTVALRVLRDLAMLTNEKRYREAAERTQLALGPMFEQAPSSVGTALRALAAGPQLPAPPLAKKAGNGTPKPLDRLPTGRDFVRSEIRRAPETTSDLLVRLKIEKGWHVNANPASLGFLIPTKVAAADPDHRIDVVYPKAANHELRFSLEPLAVYEGDVDIRISPRSTLQSGDGLDVTFQACEETTCLPPETVRLTVP